MPSTPLAESAATYFRTRDQFIELLLGLSPSQSQTVVPLSPEWSVQDVAAHVCGINADVLNRRLDGFGTDAWTHFQVESRRSQELTEICDEWRGYTDGLSSMIADDPFFGVRLTGDLIIHVHDVQHALELPVTREDPAVLVGAERYVPHLQDRVMERLGIGVAVDLVEGGVFPAPEDASGGQLQLRVGAYDFLRAVSGRRSRRQVESFDWVGDPTTVLDEAWAAYGELRVEDVSA